MFVRTPDGEQGIAPITLIPPVEGEVGSGISVPEFNVIEHVTDYPMVIDRASGAGRVIHFPWQPDLIGFRYGLRDLFQLIGNAVKSAAGWKDVVRVHGPGLVDVTVLERDDRLVVSLVNFSSPGSFNTGQRRIIQELVPLHGLELEVRAPEGFTGTAARLVFAERDVPVERRGDYLHLTLPRLDAMETIEFGIG